jgi:GntP family gluconate:H+ symporter
VDPFVILLAGTTIVVGGVLLLKLHAVLALAAAALAVLILTPTEVAVWQNRAQVAAQVVEVHDDTLVLVRPGRGSAARFKPGTRLFVVPSQAYDEPPARRPDALGQLIVVPAADAGRSRADGLRDCRWDRGPRPQPGDRVVALRTIGDRLSAAFGTTCGQIGILIAMASIIGQCLLASGAADRIVRATLRLFGEARAALAFVLSGFLLGIPVFFDTVFYLMIPLGKALRLRSGRNYLLYVLSITAGATMAHSLVPPTPGPLFVAQQLRVDLGTMILGGCFVGLFTSALGYVYAQWANRRWEIPLRDEGSLSLAELQEISQTDVSQLPPLWLSLLPIVLPVGLIAGATLLDPDVTGVALPADVQRAVDTLGNKDLAIGLAAALALLTLVAYRRGGASVSKNVQLALASGGVIILITSMGGAFGSALRDTGIGESIADLLPASARLLVLVAAFAVTTLIRTAQGSATVAMITAVGIFAPIVEKQPEMLGCHPVYLALAIGCGSKPFAWMNDSGFWVICKMSGMTEAETLKTLTPMTASMGFLGLGVTVLAAWLVPLV